MSTTREWTAEELVAELKRRERRGGSGDGRGAAGGGARSIGVTSRFRDLDDVSTGELARMAQDRQRVVYGVDDRQDIFQVRNAKIRKASDAVVALVKAADLKVDGQGGWTLATTSYEEEYQLCSSGVRVAAVRMLLLGLPGRSGCDRDGRPLREERGRSREDAVRIWLPDGERVDAQDLIWRRRRV
jgi:hypothetical protein